MKKLLFLMTTMLLLTLASFGQLPKNTETGKIEFSGVVKVDSALTQDQLYARAKEWFAQSFKAAKEVIQMDDKDAGIIIGKGIFTTPKTCGTVNFTIKIQVKDGRYKYWFTDFKHEELTRGWSGGALENEKPICGYFQMAKKVWIDFIPEATIYTVGSMTSSLKAIMIKSSKNTGKDNW